MLTCHDPLSTIVLALHEPEMTRLYFLTVVLLVGTHLHARVLGVRVLYFHIHL